MLPLPTLTPFQRTDVCQSVEIRFHIRDLDPTEMGITFRKHFFRWVRTLKVTVNGV